MVITKARQARRVAFAMGRELGEWGVINRAADPMLATSNRPKALIPSSSTGRGPGVMMPWLSAFPRIRNAVSRATAPEGD